MQCIRLIVLSLTGLVAAPVAAANLIVNGSFETPDIAGPFVTFNGTDDIDG